MKLDTANAVSLDERSRILPFALRTPGGRFH